MKEKKLTKKELQHLEKAQENLEKRKEVSKEVLEKINHKILKNILVAIVVVAYFYFINLASLNIQEEKLIIDLKVFSMVSIGITIFLFEYSYKKDSGEICIFGIESLFIALATLSLTYLFAMHYILFHFVVAWLSALLAIYYIAKSIAIYHKMKKDYLKSKSDINDIVSRKE